MLSKPDRGHLHEAALYIGAEVRVGFDPVDEHHAVGLRGDPVHVHGHLALCLSELYDLHRGAYRRPTKLFRDAQRLEDLDLPLCRSTAVAPHRRHDKRLCPHLLQDRDERAQDPIYLRDAAAPSRERHAHTGPDGRSYLLSAQLFPQRLLDALDAWPRELLPDLDHLRELHLNSSLLPVPRPPPACGLAPEPRGGSPDRPSPYRRYRRLYHDPRSF